MARTKRRTPAPAAAGVKILVRNKKAFHDYQIVERLEAGISLVGSEVKSLRESRATLTDGFVDLRDGEAWLLDVNIKPYPWANQFNHEPTRRRKLLLHKREIKKLAIRTQQRGYSLVPIAIYLKGARIKVELGLGTGKRLYEKRETSKERTAKREIAQAMKKR